MDWVITHPDDTEEGNVVGKFLDEWQKTRPQRIVRVDRSSLPNRDSVVVVLSF